MWDRDWDPISTVGYSRQKHAVVFLPTPSSELPTCWKPTGYPLAVHPWKLTWHSKIPMFNRKYIFKFWIFHCHLSFFGGVFLPSIFSFAGQISCLFSDGIPGWWWSFLRDSTHWCLGMPSGLRPFFFGGFITCLVIVDFQFELFEAFEYSSHKNPWGLVYLPIFAIKINWMWVNIYKYIIHGRYGMVWVWDLYQYVYRSYLVQGQNLGWLIHITDSGYTNLQ